MFSVCKRNVSNRRFFYATKTYLFHRQLIKSFINRPPYLNPVCPKFISKSECFEKLVFEFFEFLLYGTFSATVMYLFAITWSFSYNSFEKLSLSKTIHL